TRSGSRCSTFIAPSPRPSEKAARPRESPCSVAIALAARSGSRSGTATAVPTLSLDVAAAAAASTAYGSGSSPCASPTASPSQPLASNSCANRPISALGTGVAPIRQNSALISERDHRGGREEPGVEAPERDVRIEHSMAQPPRRRAVADRDEGRHLAVELVQERVVGLELRTHHEEVGLQLARLARHRIGERDPRAVDPL